MLIFKLTRVVCPCARESVNVIKTWKILGPSASDIRLLPSARHLATQRDSNTRFEKVDLSCIKVVDLCGLFDYSFYISFLGEHLHYPQRAVTG